MSNGQEQHDHHVIGGYKATLSNPNTSDEAKAHAREMLKEAGVEYTSEEKDMPRPHDTRSTHAGQAHSDGVAKESKEVKGGEEHDHRVLGGYKATLANPNTSDEAKAHAQQMLDQAANQHTSMSAEETTHQHHVNGGYKSTISNPNASDEAKAHAREMLKQAGEMI